MPAGLSQGAGATVNLGRLRLGPQTALQSLMLCALLALVWGGVRGLSRRDIGWARAVERTMAPYVAALVELVRTAPMTVIYVVSWTVTSVIQQGTPANIQDVVDRFNSTNLSLLAHNPVRVLFSSAFIVADRAWGFIGYALLYLTVVAAVERMIGWRRTLVVWVSSHVLGSLATAVTEAVLIHYDKLPSTVSFASDVGVSYVLVGTAGTYLWIGSRRGRWLVAGALLVTVAYPLVRYHTIWDLGHAYAFGIGAATGWLVLRGVTVRRMPGWNQIVARTRADSEGVAVGQ